MIQKEIALHGKQTRKPLSLGAFRVFARLISPVGYSLHASDGMANK